MTSYIDYFAHVTTEPDYYQRNYENDLPALEEDSSNILTQVEKVALMTLPFLSLYKPLRGVISMGMNAARVITNVSGAIDSLRRGELIAAMSHLIQVAIAMTALVATIFQFTLGLVISTALDAVSSIIDFIQHLIKGDYQKVIEDLLQLASSSLYLAIIFTGSLEIILASLVIQALLSFYQAADKFIEGNYLEGIAKSIMGVIRCYETGCTVLQIEQRNESYKEFESLLGKVKKIKEAAHLIFSAINEKSIAEKQVLLEDANGKEFDFGSHFHGLGQELVKGDNLSFKTQVIDGKEVTELNFKINHVFRDQLQKEIEFLHSHQGESLKEFLAISGTHIQDIRVEKIPYEIYEGKVIEYAEKLSFEGLGSIIVGASKDCPNLFDKVTVRMDADKNIYNLHEMLSFVNLDKALRESSAEDIERMKVGQLFRIFFPKAATPLERSEKYFTLSVEELKQEMISRVPQMKDIIDEYLPEMEGREILPGRIRYCVNGLADRARELGATALTAALTGAYSDKELFDRVASIIKMGMLSTEMRYSNGITAVGMSSTTDFYTGGADSVFTQILTEEHNDPSDLYYQSRIRLFFSLDLLETGTYQYHYDSYGTRKTSSSYTPYTTRPGILDFIQEENRPSNPFDWYHYNPYGGNEVMIKERIAPSFIEEIRVDSPRQKADLINHLQARNLIQGQGSERTILGKPVDQFIRV